MRAVRVGIFSVWFFFELRSSIPVVRAHTHHLLPTYSGSNSGLKHTKLPTYPGGVNRDRSRRAKPDDISSPLDVFGFMAHVHQRLGALPTTAGKLSSFIRGLLGDLGTNRHSARASSDPKRALGTRFVELSSVRLKDFIRYRDEQLRGREIQAQLRAAALAATHPPNLAAISRTRRLRMRPISALA